MSGNEGRKNPRLHHEMMVSVSSADGSFSGWGTNLSTGGVFVNAPGEPKGARMGAAVEILLQLPGQPECKLKGKVVWAKEQGPEVDEPGVGIQFLEVDDATRARIAELMLRLGHDLGAPAS